MVIGLVVFTAGSGLAGLAHTTELLLAARAVQGLGAALATPAALALLTTVYRQERERQRALGLLSATMDVAMVAGLILGGVLTATVGWPWCFFLVVPVGVVAAALAPPTLPESRDESAPRLDLPGAVLAATGFAMIAFGIARTDHHGPGAYIALGGGVILLAVFVVVEHRSPAPMVRLAVFRHRPLAGANVAITANAGGFGGMMFIATLYLQQVLGFSALQTGLAFVPLALSACAGGLAAPRLIAIAGPRLIGAASMLATAAAFVLLSRLPERDGFAPVVLPAAPRGRRDDVGALGVIAHAPAGERAGIVLAWNESNREVAAMARCDVCGNEYERAFQVRTHDGGAYTFDSIECAAQRLAPACAHCDCRILGHGVEAGDVVYCCAHCARESGVQSVRDSARM